MKIVGAGLSKTGTTSLHRALNILGLRSLHYDDVRLRDILNGETENPDWRRYDDVDAVLDIPSAVFYRELLGAYPASKCVLTVRDEDAWWRSIETHFNQRRPVRSSGDDPVKWAIRRFVYGSSIADERSFRERYRRHNEEVLSSVSDNRLLVLDVTSGDGWEELCPFLEIPVPSRPFPHQNRTGEEEAAFLREAVSDVLGEVSPGMAFVLIDAGIFALEWPGDRVGVPLVIRTGVPWGLPIDDAAAIEELERRRAEGATHAVFAWSSFWWLSHYMGLREHLESRYRVAVDNDRVMIFDLRP